MIDNKNGDIIIYQTDNGLTKIDVKIEMKQYGYLNNKWQNYMIQQNKI